MIDIDYTEYLDTVDGVTFVRTSYCVTSLPTPERLFNQHAVQRKPVCKRSMWKYFNIPYIEQIVNAEYSDLTFLHVPSHFSRILRWLNPPRKREPNIVEQHEAEADRLAFSDELSLTESLSISRRQYHNNLQHI